MPRILSPALILQKFLGSGGENFPICPGFCSRRKFSENFWAVAVEFFLYAQNFAPAGSSQEISGQWRQEKTYMPGMLLEVTKSYRAKAR